MSQKEAIAFAQKIAQEKKAAAKAEKAGKSSKDVRSKLIEIRRIAFRDAVSEVYGNGYYKD